MNRRDGLRRLVGTLSGACVVTLVALCFSAGPAQAQNPISITVSLSPNPVQQNASAEIDVTANPSLAGKDVSLFVVVDSKNTQTSCSAGTSFKQVSARPFDSSAHVVFGGLDTSNVGTFGYRPVVGRFGPVCADLVVTPPCAGVTFAPDQASGDGMPLFGTANEWTVRLHVHACQDVTDLSAQGSTNSWETITKIPDADTFPNENAPNPSFGTVTHKNDNKNHAITWTMTQLGDGTAGGTDATLLLDIKGTIDRKTTPFTVLDLLGSWSLTYSLDGGQTFQNTPLTGAVTVEVMPPLEPPM